RLRLGEKHVVLCTAERREDVQQALAESGSTPTRTLDRAYGVPDGWVALDGIAPERSVTSKDKGDITDILRPLPDIEIVLDGGIRIGRSVWLRGHPPAIRLLGDVT